MSRMTKSNKIRLIAGIGATGLLALIALGLVLYLNAIDYKPRLEAVTSQALGMDVKVAGPVGIGFFPSLTVKLRDVHVRTRGAEVASVEEIRLKARLWPLLFKQLQVESIAFQHPVLLIEQEADGSFDLIRAAASAGVSPALDVPTVTIADGVFRYVDKQSGDEVDGTGCSLEMRDLHLAGGKRADFLKDLGFSAEIDCKEIGNRYFAVHAAKAVAVGEHGVVTLDPVTMQVFGAEGTGSLRADYYGAVPGYAAQYSLPQFHVADFFSTLTKQAIGDGRMDFSVKLTFEGTNLAGMTDTMAGQFSLRGKDLVLKGRDLDMEFSHFESSQHFNLVDLGALFFAGPIGLVVTKGYNFGNLLRGSEGSSEIPVLVSDWKIDRGVAQSQDVAMTTRLHRLALDGRLDFAGEKFEGVTIALIDLKGCPIVVQKITGSFRHPVVEQPSFLRTLSGPVLRLIKMGRDLFPGGTCKVFYKGSVAPPLASARTP